MLQCIQKVMIGRVEDAAKKKSKSALIHWETDGSEMWLVQWLPNEVNCSQWMGAEDTDAFFFLRDWNCLLSLINSTIA